MHKIHVTPALALHRRAKGMLLIGLLITLFMTSVFAMVGIEVWSTARQREREAELLFIGNQYRQAIRRYYFAVDAGQARQLPTKLSELLNDDRFPVPMQHLRRLYPDPITGSTDWGLALNGQRIAGVYSPSEKQPLKQAGFEPANATFEARTTYRDWVFLFVPPAQRRR
jgi:type II secretory pathway pseudopilin PulG